MKITFEAEYATDLVQLLQAFVSSGDQIPADDQAILDQSLRGLRRLARRVERLDAAFPVDPATPPPPVSAS